MKITFDVPDTTLAASLTLVFLNEEETRIMVEVVGTEEI